MFGPNQYYGPRMYTVCLGLPHKTSRAGRINNGHIGTVALLA